jgi:uncharacterized protein YyaL (SSP411 family)
MQDRRTPGDIRREGNHLVGQRSLYLTQHSHNPVDWHPWTDEALALARVQDRPILLSVGYSSCHWCHVMEEQVFDKDDVALVLNERFVCIKVDREERPDIDAFYMDAVLALTGRGGWPMTVFLTPGLEPFFAGTYYPHDAFLALVGAVYEAFRTRRDRVNDEAARIHAHVAREPAVEPEARLGEDVVDEAARRCLAGHDKT